MRQVALFIASSVACWFCRVAQRAVCWSLAGCFVCDFSILGLYVSCGTEVSHVMNSDSNETIASTHHSTLRWDNIQERQQSQPQTSDANVAFCAGCFDTQACILCFLRSSVVQYECFLCSVFMDDTACVSRSHASLAGTFASSSSCRTSFGGGT